jgi:hypothetical protein
LPELIDIYNAVGKWLLENAETGNRVDVFAHEPFSGWRNALVEYLGKHAGRAKILESEPQRLFSLDPANGTFTFPGHNGKPMALTFVPNNVRYYQKLHRLFQRPLLDSLNVAEMKHLRGLLVLEIKYLRGCDLQWVPKPAGLLSTLAMLQGKILTVLVRAGTAGGVKDSGDESSSSVELVGPGPPPQAAVAIRGAEEEGDLLAHLFDYPQDRAEGRPARCTVPPLPSKNGYIGFW